MEKRKLVNAVFSSVAKNYDLMNDLMSFGLHRIWKDIFINKLLLCPGMKILDVAGGTGDIGMKILKRCPSVQLYVCDSNIKMLESGKEKFLNNGIVKEAFWICAEAECLPFRSSHFDIYTISFGLRNTYNIVKALKEAFRVIKPGGFFACLEFAPKAHGKILESAYKFYLSRLIPKMGEVVARDYSAYKYLSDSIQSFHSPQTLTKMIEDSGFSDVKYHSLNFNITMTHIDRNTLVEISNTFIAYQLFIKLA